LSRTQFQHVAAKRRPQAKDDQGLFMLLFESFSAGALAVLIVILVLLSVVGVYTIIIWPLTKWDLNGVNPESLRHGLEDVLAAVFIVGTLMGLWCFSGAAFQRRKTRRSAPART